MRPGARAGPPPAVRHPRKPSRQSVPMRAIEVTALREHLLRLGLTTREAFAVPFESPQLGLGLGLGSPEGKALAIRGVAQHREDVETLIRSHDHMLRSARQPILRTGHPRRCGKPPSNQEAWIW